MTNAAQQRVMRMRRAAIAAAMLLCLTACQAAVYHVAQRHPAASDENPGTAERPFKTISKAAQIAHPGDRIIVHEGLYREYVNPRNSGRPGAPIVYEAVEGEQVVITGADPLSGWRRLDGPRPIYWIPWPHKFIINTIGGKPIYHHPYDDRHRRSGRAEQLIVDGKVWDWPQIVLSLDEMKPGTFFPDVDAGRLYIWLPDGSNPANHSIEGCTRGLLFGTDPWHRPGGIDYIVVRGFTFRYGATFPQRPLVWLYGKGNIVEDCIIEWASGSGIKVGPEDGVLRRCVIRYCGHTGGSAYGRNFINEDCLWLGNCRKPISRGWDAGGVKIARSHGGIFQRCVFRDNGGPGLWMDIDCSNILVRQCLFADNECQGMFIEISRNITVTNNAFFRNGLRAQGPKWGLGGILLAESRNCIVAYNLFVANQEGISIREHGPRYLDTPDLGRLAYLNKGHIIARNVIALNNTYQLGLWFDTAFFGRHPADKKKFATEEEFEAFIKRKMPEKWFDPLKQGLLIDGNLYWPGAKEQVQQATGTTDARPELVLYGPPWRIRHRKFADLRKFAEATGWEVHGLVADPGLERRGNCWTLSREGLASKLNIGPRIAIPTEEDLPLPGRSMQARRR